MLRPHSLITRFFSGLCTRLTQVGLLSVCPRVSAQAVLVAVCRSNPDAFVLSYEDHDLGDGVYEHGVYDKQAQELVVRHKGLPTAAEFEGASAPRPGGGGGGGGRGGTAQGAADGSATCDGPEKKHAVAG